MQCFKGLISNYLIDIASQELVVLEASVYNLYISAQEDFILYSTRVAVLHVNV